MTYFEQLTNTRQRQPNTMVAGISSMILQIRKENIKQSLSGLNTIEHRQEYIATVDGVMYYDDSRAENVNATWFTFQNIIKPVIWVAGGDVNGTDFKELKRIAKKKVKAMVCIGSEHESLKKAFQKDVKDIFDASSLEEAITTASLIAQEGDIVLFSPACKSDDEQTYIERGDLFTEIVRRMENEHNQ